MKLEDRQQNNAPLQVNTELAPWSHAFPGDNHDRYVDWYVIEEKEEEEEGEEEEEKKDHNDDSIKICRWAGLGWEAPTGVGSLKGLFLLLTHTHSC